MPGRRTHKLVGGAAGMAFALYRAQNQTPANQIAEAAGGATGGAFVGGPLADILEPALSPWHRGPAHSWAAGAAIVSFRTTLAAWEAECRRKADQWKALPSQPLEYPGGTVFVPITTGPLSQFLRQLCELFWRFLAGFLNGVAAGYVSHLALDAFTPRSIPLLGIKGELPS